MKRIRFTVFGKPQTAGSKRAFVPLNRQTGEPFRRENGGVIVNTVDDNKYTKAWQRQVAMAAKNAHDGPPLQGALIFSALFYLERPKSHWSTGKKKSHLLRNSAPMEHIGKPDVLKLARAIEDACSGILYVDDSQIVEETLFKRYVGTRDTLPHVVIQVEPLIF